MYNTILVPLDGSVTAQAALEQARGLAVLCKARVRLLHVLDMAALSDGFENAQAYVETTRPLAMKQAGEMLDRARELLEKSGVETDIEIEDAIGTRVSDAIVARAAACKADIIVIGTHGRRGVGRVLMGSDAERVARTSPVPVLLVRYAPKIS